MGVTFVTFVTCDFCHSSILCSLFSVLCSLSSFIFHLSSLLSPLSSLLSPLSSLLSPLSSFIFQLSSFIFHLSSSELYQHHIDICWTYARYSRCLPYRFWADSVEFLTCLNGHSTQRREIKTFGNGDVFQSM